MAIRKALAYAFTTRYLALVVQFASTMVLARLLTPAEIGIYSVGAAIIMIAQTLRDFGTSTYIIQESELSRERLATAFTVTLFVAWSIAAGLWIVAEPAARFYSEPGVREVMQVMALNFALLPLGSISMALLRRNMNFQAIMYITMASAVAQSASSVLFAWLGWGFISLAWGAVCGSMTSVIGAMLASPHSVLFRPTLCERRRVLSFSLKSSVSSIAAEAGHSAPDLVLGRTLGMEATGLFSRAMGYVQLFERLLQDVLRSVMLPYLADAERAGFNVPAKLKHALSNIVSVSVFIIALTAVLAEPLILLLFGHQWKAAIPIAQILCVAMMIRCAAPTVAAALVANGQITLVMRSNLLSSGLKFLLLAVCSSYGVEYAAVGFVVAELLSMSLLIAYCNKCSLITPRGFFLIYAKVIPLTMAGVLPAIIMVFYFALPQESYYIAFFSSLAGISSLIFWISMLYVTRSPLAEEIELLKKNWKNFRS